MAGIEISVSPEARDLLFFGWACRISENFYGKGPYFKEMGVQACLHFAAISYTALWDCIRSIFIRDISEKGAT
jgi:hypothetical protein